MKKALMVLLVILSVSSVFATVKMGYSIAVTGEKSPVDSAFGALGVSALLSPWSETHVADIEIETLISPVSPFFNGVNIKVSSPLFLTIKHPFAFIFPNTVYWSPRLTVGAQYRMDNEWNLYLGLAPFSFQDTNYIYEFFSPYALYNIKDNSWGYGAYIMKFTVFLGGKA